MQGSGDNGHSAGRRTGGRSARVREAVLDATIEVALARGVDAMSIREIADRAGVHETSVYRRWGSAANLALDALLSRLDSEVPVPDTGSLRADLVALLGEIAGFTATPLGEMALRAGLRMDLDAEFEAARADFWGTRFRILAEVLARAERRGELRPGLSYRLIWESMLGALHARWLLSGAPVPEGFSADIADLLLLGIAQAPDQVTGQVTGTPATPPR